MAEPVETAGAGEFEFSWSDFNVAIRLTRIHDTKREGMSGDIFVSTTAEGFGPHLRWERLNMSSARMRGSLAKDLAGIMPLPPWESLIEYACTVAMVRTREGEPVMEIGNLPDADTSFLLENLVLADNPTLIYADGGAGKSYLALAIALHIDLGFDFLGSRVRPEGAKALYLDYEFSKEEHDRRLKALARGLDLDGSPTILYRRCAYPIYEEVMVLQRLVRQAGVQFVVVDSAGAACGGEPESAQAVLLVWAALRQMEVTPLVLTHVPKDRKNRGAFGSTYWRNGARLSWEMRSEQAEGSDNLKVALYNDKANISGRLRPVGFQFNFSRDSVSLERWNPKDSPGHVERLSIPGQIEYLLLDERRPMTTIQIAEALGLKDTSVRATLNRNVHKFVHTEGGWGLLSK